MTGRTSGRTHGRIYVDIWAHMAEHNMTRDARYVYPFLVCQAKLSLCGAMDIRMRSWAKQLAMSVEELDAALTELTECEWLFIDDDTEEMWVTGYIDREVNVRNRDTMKGALRAVNRVESLAIRQLALDALAGKGGDVTLLDPKDDGSRSPDTSGGAPPARAPAQPRGEPPAAAPRAPYQRPETLITTSQPTGLTRAVDNSQDSGNQQLAAQWIDAHVAHRAHRIRHPTAFRRALHPAVTAVIHQAHNQAIDPRPLLAERWPIDNPDLWDGLTVDDLAGLGPPTDSPLTRFHRRLEAAGLWTTT